MSGEIPLKLVGLIFLEGFSLAHNNLSGRVLDMKARFGTFGENNYEDNHFLCRLMLKRKCNISIESPYLPSQPCKEKWGKMIWYWCCFLCKFYYIIYHDLTRFCYLPLHLPLLALKMVQFYRGMYIFLLLSYLSHSFHVFPIFCV